LPILLEQGQEIRSILPTDTSISAQILGTQFVHQLFTMTLIPSAQSDFTGVFTANQEMKEPANFQLSKITAFI